MSKPFDHTLKVLIETWPADWLRLLGLPAEGTIEAIDTELPALSVHADRVFRISGPPKYIAHIEPQSTYKEDLPDRVFLYNVLVYRRHTAPVISTVVLLRPKADGPLMTGVVERHDPNGRCYLRFEYGIIRLWEIPVETVFAGGPGVWPLAPLARDAEAQIEDVIHGLKRRTEAVPPQRQREILAAAYVLTGLLERPEIGAAILRGVPSMKESVTYQEILAEGRAEGRVEARVETLQEVILELGGRSYGSAPQPVQRAVRGTRDYDRLHEMLLKIGEAAGWSELLGTSNGDPTP